jgi:thiol-disulfide isomerase/thioredoxin
VVRRPLPAALSRALALAAALCALPLAARADAPALVSLTGEPAALERAPGERALVVHFWATWCASCVHEIPVVARAAAECAPHGVRIRIAAAGESAAAVRKYQADHAIAFESWLDPHGRAWRAAGGFGLPANWIRTDAGDRLLPGLRSPAQWSELLGELGCPFAR